MAHNQKGEREKREREKGVPDFLPSSFEYLKNFFGEETAGQKVQMRRKRIDDKRLNRN